MHAQSSDELHCMDLLILVPVCFNYARVEGFAKEDMDLTLATSLEFSTPFADLSDVKTMMDSINVVPGLIFTPHVFLCCKFLL